MGIGCITLRRGLRREWDAVGAGAWAGRAGRGLGGDDAGLAAQGFHVYVPDLLGYGRSPKPDVDYSISLEEKTVVEFMQAVHVPRADVGGWSMGGWIAMKLALDHPEMVDRLVVYDSAGVYFPATLAAGSVYAYR